MRFILPILFLFFGFNAFSQVDFEKQTNAKNYLSFYSSIATIADTSNIKNGIWDGATVFVEDSGKVFVYNGTGFIEIQQGIQSTPDTSALLVYAPAHGLADSITLYGYVPVRTNYTRATADVLSNVHFAYAVDSPHPDTLELKIAGYLNLGLNHGLTLGELYYLQDNGTQALTAGTVRAPTVVVLSATEVILLEVGADEDQVIARVPIISPTISAAGGNPIIPTDSIIQVVIETIYKPAGLAKPGTIFFTTYISQSSNLTYRESTNNPLTPSYSWLWDGKTATRINTLITSIDLESTTSGGLTLTPVTAVPPNDSLVAQWLETNYTTNNLRLYNGSILYYEGAGTAQSPQRQWVVIDDLSNGAEANNYKRIIKNIGIEKQIPQDSADFQMLRQRNGTLVEFPINKPQLSDTATLVPMKGATVFFEDVSEHWSWDGIKWEAGVFGGGGKGITEALVFKGDSLTFQQKTWINTTKNIEVLAVKPAGSDSLYFMKKRDGKLVKISSILTPSGGGGEKIVFADKLNLMYVSIANYTAKYDISDTYNPIFLSNEALSGQITSYDPFKNVLISTDNTGTFYVYSTNLELLATHAFFGNILQSPDWTEVRDERAYISCRGEGFLGSNIVTIDYSNLDSVYTVDTIKFAEGRPPGGIGLHGSIIYTYSTDSLFAIETNAENPFVLNSIALPDSVQTNSLVSGNVGVWPANGLTIIGERAFVAAPNKDQVWIFNISDPDNIFYDFLIDFPAGSSVSSTEYFKGLLVFGSSKNASLYQILGNNSAEKIQSNIIESAVLSAINIDAKTVISNTIYAENSVAYNGYFTGNLSFSKYSEKTTKDPVYLIGVDSNGNVANIVPTNDILLKDTTSYTTNQTIRLGEYNLADVRAGAVTFTIPVGAKAGQSFTVVDSWGNSGTNNITINLVTNSYLSHGVAGNYTMNVDDSITKWTFINAAVGWIVETK